MKSLLFKVTVKKDYTNFDIVKEKAVCSRKNPGSDKVHLILLHLAKLLICSRPQFLYL